MTVGAISNKSQNLPQPTDERKLERDHASLSNVTHISATTDNPSPCPTLLFIPVAIRNESYTAMLDSGSAVSIMSLDTLLKTHPHVTINPTPITLVAANNTTIEVVGQ